MQMNYKSQIFLQSYLISFPRLAFLHIIIIFHVLAAEIIADLQIKMLLCSTGTARVCVSMIRWHWQTTLEVIQPRQTTHRNESQRVAFALLTLTGQAGAVVTRREEREGVLRLSKWRPIQGVATCRIRSKQRIGGKGWLRLQHCNMPGAGCRCQTPPGDAGTRCQMQKTTAKSDKKDDDDDDEEGEEEEAEDDSRRHSRPDVCWVG